MSKLLIIATIFINPSIAFAQNAPAAPESGFMSFLPLILIFGIFYFLLIRPQQKKAKEHQTMVNELKIGNRVCTASGIVGTIKKIDEKENMIDLEVCEDTIITMLKASVNQVLESKKPTKKIAKTSKTSKAKKTKK